MAGKILVIEDDAATADFIVKALDEEGFVVDRAADGRDGLFHATDSSYDCIVLDRMLPGLDGMAVLAALRGAGIDTPVIVLSALGTQEDRIKGLTSGSDDYLTKPFAFAELLARIRVLIRRGSSGPTAVTTLGCGDLEMDLLQRRVTRAGRRLDLLPREFKLLEHLLRHKDRVVTRTMMLEELWDYRFDPHTSLIDTHISRLRKKIDDGFETPLLHTVRGSGYRLSERV